MTEKERGQAAQSLTMTAGLVHLLKDGVTVPFFRRPLCAVTIDRSFHVHAVKEVHGRVGGDFKPRPK